MIRIAAVAASLMLTTVGVLAQSGVPPELMKNTRRQAGDSINVCFDKTSLGRPFDEAIATAIGDALFLEVKIIEGFGGFPLSGDGFLDELTLAMNNTCDLFMGVSVSTNTPVSEAFAITRPYATIPFVTVVADNQWQSLGDIPRDQRIGAAMASMGDLNLITWLQQQPEEQRWTRLPYADPNLMMTRLLDGTISGMILWQPVLARLQSERTDAGDLRIVANSPLSDSAVKVGALVSSRNSFLRSQVDQAIDALVADGTIENLLSDFGYGGHAGE